MQLAAILLVPLLLSAPFALKTDLAPTWSNAATPGGGPVQGIGGSSEVLVASTWSRGAFRSYDNGRHWEPIPGLPPVSEARVQFDPSDPNVGYVYGFGGVARTTDAGQTWTHVLDTGVTYRLAVSPSGAVAASYRDPDWGTHIFLSHDRGETWTDLGAPLPPFTSLYGLAFGARDDELVTMTIGSMYVTHDGGATWTETRHSFLDLRRAPDGTLWAAGFTIAKSTDGGATWQDAGAPSRGWPAAVGDDGRVFVRSHDGVLTTADGGATWESLGAGDATFGATSLLADPEDPEAVLVSDEFLGVSRVSRAGFESRSTGLPPVDVLALAASADGSVLLASGSQGIYASRDGGESWSHTGAGMGFWETTAVAASADGAVLYGGGRTRVFSPFLLASRDGGATWTFRGPNVGGDGSIGGIVVDPADGQHAFAVATMDLASSKLLETRNGGGAWNIVLDLPIKVRDVAWDARAGKPILATELGVLVYEGPNLVSPRGATFNTWTVAAQDGRSWSNGPEVSIWSGADGMPHAPWADSGGYLVDLAPQTRELVWGVNDGGAIARCVERACEDARAPHAANAVLVAGGAAFAATTDGGIYRASL